MTIDLFEVGGFLMFSVACRFFLFGRLRHRRFKYGIATGLHCSLVYSLSVPQVPEPFISHLPDVHCSSGDRAGQALRYERILT